MSLCASWLKSEAWRVASKAASRLAVVLASNPFTASLANASACAEPQRASCRQASGVQWGQWGQKGGPDTLNPEPRKMAGVRLAEACTPASRLVLMHAAGGAWALWTGHRLVLLNRWPVLQSSIMHGLKLQGMSGFMLAACKQKATVRIGPAINASMTGQQHTSYAIPTLLWTLLPPKLITSGGRLEPPIPTTHCAISS